ncbi:hypothetical protein I4F81_000519 [Pyropia yezoensis]|uniref:Uncharacterized protein n=1 Tax=Pyropia yezoensis TaxID=2788 RepID=A0ACC3BIX3_PYRYE|nr:hypothetical protein I4F81_000519 [Neopyropia yezoensis]
MFGAAIITAAVAFAAGACTVRLARLPAWLAALRPQLAASYTPPAWLTAIAAGVACGGRLRLADVVGTGKIAIALALASVYHRPETPTHIIVPASLGVPQARALRM